MPVGNDVVDLKDPDSQPDRIHARFDLRVFSRPELQLISRAPDGPSRHLLRWTLWAAKESAFKYLRQADSSIPFHPREFEVSPGPRGQAVVRMGELRRIASIDATPDRVHAVVADDTRAALSGVSRIDPAPSPAEASARVRSDACAAIGALLGIDPVEVSVSRDDGGPGSPVARRSGSPLPVEVSLSHHGRWVAHAVVVSRGGVPV